MEPPPIIKPHVSEFRSRLFAGLALLLVVVLGSMALLVYLALPRPPKDHILTKNFYKNRASFEKMRDMLLADEQLRRVASWGVETTKPFYLGEVSGSGFPEDRYAQYLALLKRVGGFVASRGEGEHPSASILVWGWGLAGHTRHVGICWTDQAPTNQVATLDGYHGRSAYAVRHIAYRHIDENWYLWTDL
jgi:hypothetical protein